MIQTVIFGMRRVGLVDGASASEAGGRGFESRPPSLAAPRRTQQASHTKLTGLVRTAAAHLQPLGAWVGIMCTSAVV